MTSPAATSDDDTLPNPLPRPPDELERLKRAWEPPKGWRVLRAVNNTHIGLFYTGVALVFFVLAGMLALLMRAQLAVPDNTLVAPSTFNQLFTMHGTVMMFLFAVPVVEAISVYLLPGMIGARDLPFPRLSAFAFWAYAIGGTVFFTTIFFGASPDGGWFMYPPLTSHEHSPGIGQDWWLLGIGFIEISAIAGAIELIIGILFTRAPGMTLSRMPVYCWAMLVVALMIVFAFPAVIAGTTLLEVERAFDWPFFIADRGGDPVLWQHLFWFFGHPEVYIIFLPAAGLVSMMIPTLTRGPLVGYRAIVAALIGTGVISFALWVHHMFTAGLGRFETMLVSAASLAIAIPAGVQVFAWLATMWQGRLRLNAAGLFILGFLIIFVLGGLTGVMIAVLPFDRQVHDSYFIVAHLHYVLIGGLVFPIFASLYHWTPLINGHCMSERVARWVFGLMFGGFNLTFFPMHIAGLLGMPRRVYTYADGLGLNAVNLLSSIGALIFAIGVLVFIVDAVRTWRRKSVEHGNPWNAGTLEWLPNDSYATRSIPQVVSREPLWTRPTLPEEVVAGRHWLPGNPTGRRETIVTSAVDARPLHLLILPADGWLPLLAGIGIAGLFLLLTVKYVALAVLFGIGGLVATLAWLWPTDRPVGIDRVTIGRDVEIPVGASGRRSHSWWAMVVLLLVDATIFASFVFAHLHVSMRAEVCPPPGAALPPDAAAWGSIAAWLVSSLLIVAACRWPLERLTTRRKLAIGGLLIAALASAALALAVELGGHLSAGLAPTTNAWSATVGIVLGFQAFHVAVLVVMAGFVLARLGHGHLGPRHRATLDNVALFWHYTVAQGVFGLAFVQWLPGWM